MRILDEHLDPRPTEIGERFRFSKCHQHEGEAISDYVADLRRLSLHCESLITALRNQLAFGLRNEHVQQRLLKDKDLTFDVAVETAKLDETASRNTLELQVKLSDV